jgi:hypothetical protein
LQPRLLRKGTSYFLRSFEAAPRRRTMFHAA